MSDIPAAVSTAFAVRTASNSARNRGVKGALSSPGIEPETTDVPLSALSDARAESTPLEFVVPESPEECDSIVDGCGEEHVDGEPGRKVSCGSSCRAAAR